MTWKTLAVLSLGLGLMATVGCNSKKDDKAGGNGGGGGKKEEHSHGSGPNGGVMFDIAGGKYHGEFKPSHKDKTATVWIYGADEKTLTPVKTEKVKLVISNTNPKIEMDLTPTDKKADGSAATFTGKHDGLAVEMEYKGTITFLVDGMPYNGDFEEKAEKK